jgi:glycosyltransferase involved in cell wall biosynthesis
MSNDRISVIITVLNEKESVQTLLKTIFSQSHKPDEVVIVDGGSTDGTSEILEEYANRDSRLRFFVKPGVNIARGRNIAIQKASCPIIAVTDGGCKPHEDWLKEIMRPLLEDETISAVSGAIRVDARNRFEAFSGLLSTSRDSDNPDTRLFFTRSCAFRKSLWESVGGMPEWLYTGEDTLFALRARQAGYKIVYASRSIIDWRPRPTLFKLAKQFFLYGRGNGRINHGNIRGALYWMRYHALWFITLVVGIAFPWAWIATGLTLTYLYFILILPVLNKVRSDVKDFMREFYVPIIVLTRNMFTNLGYLVGLLEYYQVPRFRENLKGYYSGTWKCKSE